MDYEIIFPADRNVTESKFYFQKFVEDFGDYKHIKTQIALKKGISKECSKAEQYV